MRSFIKSLLFLIFICLCACDGQMEVQCAGCLPPDLVTTAFVPGTSDSVQIQSINDSLVETGVIGAEKMDSLRIVYAGHSISTYCDESKHVIGDVRHLVRGDTVFFWISYENLKKDYSKASLCADMYEGFDDYPKFDIYLSKDLKIKYFVVLGKPSIICDVETYVGEKTDDGGWEFSSDNKESFIW